MNLRAGISLRLALAFVTLIAGLLGLGAWCLDRMAVADREVAVLANEEWPCILRAHRALDLMNENSRISLALFLVGDRPEVERRIAQQDRNREDITRLMAQIDGSQRSAAGRGLFDAVKLARAHYVDSFTRARARLLEGRVDEGRTIAVEEVLPRLNDLRQSWAAFFAFESDLMSRTAEVSQQKYRSARRSVFAVSILVALFAAVMAAGITRSLRITFRDLERARNEAQAATRTLSLEMAARAKVELELWQAQKLESVGRLAAGVAHEINTPVQFVGDNVCFVRSAVEDLARLTERYRAVQRSVLQGAPARAAALVAQEVEESVRLGRLLDNLPRAIDASLEGLDRIAAIVRSMKEFAHPGQREMAPVDLNLAIANTLTIARNEYKYVADVHTSLGELPPVVGHGGDLCQVLLNIVVNAAHAVADQVGDSGRRGTIGVRTWAEGETVKIAISDTGGGIPEAIQGKIFEPFFTTKPVGRGTGQGLAIARSVVVDRHGGSLTFQTEAGKGTTFLIEVPVRPAARGARYAAASA
jgi:signal transduction histidine kinase